LPKKAITYYEILGVQPEVSVLEIKRAYRELAKSHHPDVKFHGKVDGRLDDENAFMANLNEAYEILKDRRRRAEYDSTIGANGHSRSIRGKAPIFNEDEERETFLRQIFHPARHSIGRVLTKYKDELHELSQDIYDDDLVMSFEKYVDELEETLRKASNGLSSRVVPSSLRAGVQMMRYSIAQAADGLDELRRFCQNYDYSHLHMAANVFKESSELSRKALQLSKM